MRYPLFFILLLFAGTLLYAQQAKWKHELNKIPGKAQQCNWIQDVILDMRFPENHKEMLDAGFKLANELNNDSLMGKMHYARALFSDRNANLKEAINGYRQARFYFLKSRLPDQCIKVLAKEAGVLITMNLPDSALHFMDSNRSLLKKSSNKNMILYFESMYLAACQNAGFYDLALKKYMELIPLAEAAGDTGILVSTYMNIGELHNTRDSALMWLKEAENVVHGTNHSMYPAALLKMAKLYLEEDGVKRDSALYYLKEAEKYQANFKDNIYRHDLYNTLGAFFFSKYEFAMALPEFRKALTFYSEESKRTNMVMNNMALCMIRLHQTDSAALYIRRFEAVLSRKGGDEYEQLLYHQTKGLYFSFTKDSCAIEALEENVKALSFALLLEDTRLGTSLLLNVLECMSNKPVTDKRHVALADKILGYCKAFYEPLKKDEKLLNFSSFLEGYANLEAKYGNKDKAIALFIEYGQTVNRMHEQNYTEGINDAMIKYKAELKDAEIALAGERNARLTTAVALLFLFAIIIMLALWKAGRLNSKVKAQNVEISGQKNELEQLNRVKDRLFSIISHDMRTPVNSLINFGKLLERGNLSPEKMTAYTLELKNTLGYTASLMNNLLNWARTQMQGYKPLMESLELHKQVNEEIASLGQEAGRKHISLQSSIEPGTMVYADSNILALISRNLLTNAIKYTAEGGEVCVSVSREEEYVLMQVKDNGVGMSREQVDAFNSNKHEMMESSAGTASETGTGMGLLLCRSFIVLMGGSISLSSEPGKGSCFTVVLKRA